MRGACLSKVRQRSRCEKFELGRRVAHNELDVPIVMLWNAMIPTSWSCSSQLPEGAVEGTREELLLSKKKERQTRRVALIEKDPPLVKFVLSRSSPSTRLLQASKFRTIDRSDGAS